MTLRLPLFLHLEHFLCFHHYYIFEAHHARISHITIHHSDFSINSTFARLFWRLDNLLQTSLQNWWCNIDFLGQFVCLENQQLTIK